MHHTFSTLYSAYPLLLASSRYSLLLSLPLHDLFLVAASPYRVLEHPTPGGGVGLLCLICPHLQCQGCPKKPVLSKENKEHIDKPKITLKIKKELIEKKHKKDKKEKKKDKERRKEQIVLPSGLVMTCSTCSTVFNSVTGLGEHRRICKAK